MNDSTSSQSLAVCACHFLRSLTHYLCVYVCGVCSPGHTGSSITIHDWNDSLTAAAEQTKASARAAALV